MDEQEVVCGAGITAPHKAKAAVQQLGAGAGVADTAKPTPIVKRKYDVESGMCPEDRSRLCKGEKDGTVIKCVDPTGLDEQEVVCPVITPEAAVRELEARGAGASDMQAASGLPLRKE